MTGNRRHISDAFFITALRVMDYTGRLDQTHPPAGALRAWGERRPSCMSRLATKLPLYAWVGLCLCATVLVLVISDLPAEQSAWVTLDAAGFRAWAIILVIAITWLGNSTFWCWLIVVAFGSGWFWFHVKSQQRKNAELTSTK
jgi:hypothetical protein